MRLKRPIGRPRTTSIGSAQPHESGAPAPRTRPPTANTAAPAKRSSPARNAPYGRSLRLWALPHTKLPPKLCRPHARNLLVAYEASAEQLVRPLRDRQAGKRRWPWAQPNPSVGAGGPFKWARPTSGGQWAVHDRSPRRPVIFRLRENTMKVESGKGTAHDRRRRTTLRENKK